MIFFVWMFFKTKSIWYWTWDLRLTKDLLDESIFLLFYYEHDSVQYMLAHRRSKDFFERGKDRCTNFMNACESGQNSIFQQVCNRIAELQPKKVKYHECHLSFHVDRKFLFKKTHASKDLFTATSWPSSLTSGNIQKFFPFRPINFDITLANMVFMSTQCHVSVLFTYKSHQRLAIPSALRAKTQCYSGSS